MSPRSSRAPSARSSSRSTAAGPGAVARWALAIAAPAVPLAVVILARLPVAPTPEVLRLVMLVVVALVGVALGGAPAVLTALVATALGWYRPDLGRWAVDVATDGPTLAAFAATALVVALAAGARRGAAANVRWLQRELSVAVDHAEESHRTVERLSTETAALRAEAQRTAAELAHARAAADRSERSRKAILAGLPHELRAPHVVPPAPLQLFPPLLTAAPIGVPGGLPPRGPDAGSPSPDGDPGTP